MQVLPVSESGRSARATGPRGPKYVPPANPKLIPFSKLLEIGCRAEFEPQQTNFLKAITKGDVTGEGRVYVAGNVDLLKSRCIAVIGARKASDLGRRRARQLGRQLAEAGVVVTSGLAEGIDTEALSGAIEAGGKVVAVIGTPLDKAYPASNKALQELIYNEHLLISQFAPGDRVFPANFPARNRTMAALSDASVVIEASDSSGTLHQAAECQRLGRWLVIARSVVNDENLTWPGKFLQSPKTKILDSTAQLLADLYPA